MSLCHDVDLNVDIAMARVRERGAVSTLQALEPRALIPGTQKKRDKLMLNLLRKLTVGSSTNTLGHLKYEFLILSFSSLLFYL